ncbi:hypothetical protein PF005_g1617 [Phytophthora fragariae]|uniref:Uncharacterized protein n=1 Tax=Phytophthora fragariae TaxID=53985 RepID=A0A6A3ZE67_9STRA|nr:hypothetical protein PF003_g19900 [Phytophthora fragariae]KAE8896440.1 hypothetical protein PF003_g19901 [Phytophthora fragariae]KAE8948848.1 hypothetical protein PF009_g1639 [Phytophthora fragariae]KAE8965414.1 hypothetical protein PF011_g28297 [Phytophthora fragariae]KAE9055985.1 hypothetical protein PF006_g32816 [Phytophthora fragariae]
MASKNSVRYPPHLNTQEAYSYSTGDVTFSTFQSVFMDCSAKGSGTKMNVFTACAGCCSTRSVPSVLLPPQYNPAGLD